MRDCTLKEVEHFNEKFVNYMRSGSNQVISEGALFPHVCLNINEYWLTEVKDQGFIKETKADATGENLEGLIIIEALKISKENHNFPAEYAQKLLIQTFLDAQSSKSIFQTNQKELAANSGLGPIVTPGPWNQLSQYREWMVQMGVGTGTSTRPNQNTLKPEVILLLNESSHNL